MKNEDYITEYIETRGLSQNTKNKLKSVLNHYSKFQQTTLHQLLIEADTEEEKRIRWKHRKLKNRLTQYMIYLKKTMTINSAKDYFRYVKSFYRHHYIEIGMLPAFNHKNAIVLKPITVKDLPDKEIIKSAVEIASPLMKALILFLATSGMSKVEALELSIQDFINATSKYHNETNILLVLETLQNTSDVIPVWNCRRNKTNKFFITFNTPEATHYILNYLYERNKKQQLSKTDKLFKISSDYYTSKFAELNNMLGLGKAGAYNRFRGHMLRKFHASQLQKYGMERYLVNVMQGKSNSKVDDVYFFEDEDLLLKKYTGAITGLLFFTDVNEFNVYSDEYLAIVEENRLLKKQNSKVKQLEEDIKEIQSWYLKD